MNVANVVVISANTKLANEKKYLVDKNNTYNEMQIHKLKTINPYFTAAWKGLKMFEVRKNDRDFKEGDKVHLWEYDAENDNYSGREIRGEITYVLKEYEDVKDGYVIFGFTKYMNISSGEVQ